jgi:hypothetical protein
LSTHVETQLRKQNPNIMNLVKRYNIAAADVNTCIDRQLAPPTARKLPLVDRATVFALDVDDPIWDNSYFEDLGVDVPSWMGDDDMRTGIRAHLEASRCQEEVDRLVVECCNLQAWCRSEWAKISMALPSYSMCSYSGLPLYLTQSCR